MRTLYLGSSHNRPLRIDPLSSQPFSTWESGRSLEVRVVPKTYRVRSGHVITKSKNLDCLLRIHTWFD